MRHLRSLGKYFWKYRIRLGAGIIFVIISNYFSVLSPQLMKFIVNYVDHAISNKPYINEKSSYDFLVQKTINYLSQNNSISQVVIIASLIILLLALLRGFFLFLMRQTIIVMSRYIEFDQKNDIYKKYQELDAAFFKRHAVGDLMNRISEDVARVRTFTGPAIMYIVNLVTVISLSVYFMLKSSPTLTMFVLIPLPILAIVIYYVNITIHRSSEKIQAALSDLTTNAQQSYSGIRVIKSFVQEQSMLHYFKQNSERYRNNALKLAKVEAIYYPSITLLIGMSVLLTIMMGGIYYINHQHNISIGTIVEFVVYVNMLTFPVSAIGLTASMVQRGAASQKRINEFLQITPAIHDAANSVDRPISGDIKFSQVNFTYPDTGIQALKDLNFFIKRGEKVAIIGKTGSGKSTIVQLLLRMYAPNSGEVLIDERDIKEMKISSLRNQISYVPQDMFLFSESVKENIAFGKNNATMDEIKNAANMAGIDAEIEKFPQGYDTMVGERGVTLSGGQKQRISIARGLLKKASIIIFDDSLSAVDAKTEQQIIHSLNNYLKDQTAIIITHRIFSLMQFDKIIVMDEGKIVEEGSHELLLSNAYGYYSQLLKLQQEGFDDTE